MKPPRRLTPAEADALVAHMTPAERRREIEIIMTALRIKGIDVEEIFDGAGRSFLKVDLDQVRKVAPEMAELFAELQPFMPEPIGYTPPTA